MVMTRRQREIVDFIQAYLRRRGYAPSIVEIGRHLGVTSPATVHKHLQGLERRGLIRRRAHQGRSVEILDRTNGGAAAVALLGRVAAGRPIEALESAETVVLPEDLLGRRETFALRVVGDSMVGDGILDGDIVVVEACDDAPNGATVVALVGGEATVKRLHRRRGKIHLLPANERHQPIVANPADVRIRGVVVGLLRRYR
jgi:repressor LexA